eukprot:2656554-Amphidinium_carterae.1
MVEQKFCSCLSFKAAYTEAKPNFEAPSTQALKWVPFPGFYEALWVITWEGLSCMVGVVCTYNVSNIRPTSEEKHLDGRALSDAAG